MSAEAPKPPEPQELSRRNKAYANEPPSNALYSVGQHVKFFMQGTNHTGTIIRVMNGLTYNSPYSAYEISLDPASRAVINSPKVSIPENLIVEEIIGGRRRKYRKTRKTRKVRKTRKH